MSSTAVPIYFELSWSILSSIGLINVLFGLLVAGITSFSPISLVPIIVSAACAVANGMCYYAFYADYPQIPVVVAGAFADIMWLIQEAGMSFYSYQILRRVLKGKDRTLFYIIFWSLMAVIVTIRIVILISRALDNLSTTTDLQDRINHLHVGYFVTIAVVESLSAYFLLRIFAAAEATSAVVYSKSSLFRHLMRSTEIRLTTLALIGITRAITYSFQTTAQSATSTASQVDRFAYTLECLFPVVMLIDIMGSRLMVQNHIHETSSNTRSRVKNGAIGAEFSTANDGSIYPNNFSSHKSGSRIRTFNGGTSVGQGPSYPLSSIETTVDAHHDKSSSEERIIGAVNQQENDDVRDPFSEELKSGGISKTVEFEFHETTTKGV